MPENGEHLNYTQSVMKRISKLGHTLPVALPPAGDYIPCRLHEGFGFLAAQTSGYDGRFTGQVGNALTLEQGKKAAEVAALNALARIHQELGGFERLIGLLHVAGHVSSAPDFFDQPEVLDGASRIFNYALGKQGEHTRTAYAPMYLPKQITIELEITFAYMN